MMLSRFRSSKVSGRALNLLRDRSNFFSLSHVQRMLGGNPVGGKVREGEGGRNGGRRSLTRAVLTCDVLRVARKVSQEVVGEEKVAEFWELEHATGDVGQLVVRGIKVHKTVEGERCKNNIHRQYYCTP